MSDRLPPDWRDVLVDMIRGARPAEAGWFTGGPVCTPDEQLAIYLDQYKLRLFDTLVDDVPGTAWCLGDACGPLLRRYLAEQPSRSWTLNRVAWTLPEWLDAQDALPEDVIDMARLDVAIQQGFDAADCPPLRPAHLVSLPPLRLQPHVRLLRLRSHVHEQRAAALTGATIPDVRRGDVPLVVFRRARVMRTLPIHPGAWSILDALRNGVPTADAIASVQADPHELVHLLTAWFRDFASLDLVGPA